MAGGPRAPSQAPGVFHAKLRFNEERHSPGSPVGAAALAYACQANPTGEAAAKAACASTPRFQQSFCQASANGWHLTGSPEPCEPCSAGRVSAPRCREAVTNHVAPAQEIDAPANPLGAMPRCETQRPAARPVVRFVGRVGSNVFMAHCLMIENLSQNRCSPSSIAYGSAEQAGESGRSRRLEGGQVVRPRVRLLVRVSVGRRLSASVERQQQTQVGYPLTFRLSDT